MKPPSTALLRAYSPFRTTPSIPWTARGCLLQQQKPSQRQQCAPFSTSPQLQKRKRQGPKKDKRITEIRYHLQHPLTPRPLRFSRTRYLRHWTIHRAWRLYQANQRAEQRRSLQRQWTSMYWACEHLRHIDNYGLTAADREKLGEPPLAGNEQKETGRLFRIAMLKNGVWDGVPIEYARMQTESPARDGWNHAWTR